MALFSSIIISTGAAVNEISSNIREVTQRIVVTRLGFNNLLDELRIWVLPLERCWNHFRPQSNCRKSMVRSLGTVLPLPPTARVHIKILDELKMYRCQLSYPYDDECVEVGDRLSSTPIDANILMSPVSVANPRAEMRIAHLEDELLRLRAQIATILSSKESYRSCDNEVAAVRRKVLPSAPPPPPPPLPTTILSNYTVPTKLSIKQTSASRQSKDGLPDFKEILKDIGNVQLRKTESVRSPGGTPFRPKNSMDVTRQDTAAILTAVLKKRYMHIHSFSPDQSTEAFSEYSWSDTCSPAKPKVQATVVM